jgi:hypothetical protein
MSLQVAKRSAISVQIVIGGEPMAAGPEMRGDYAEHR